MCVEFSSFPNLICSRILLLDCGKHCIEDLEDPGVTAIDDFEGMQQELRAERITILQEKSKRARIP